MRTRLLWTFTGLLMLIGGAAAFGPGMPLETTRDTCLACRATKETRWILGVSRSRIVHNSYSSEVRAKHPTHQHQWRTCGSTLGYSLAGKRYACGRPHPIWQLPVEVHARYAGLVSSEELQATLNSIDSDATAVADEAVQKVFEKVLNDEAATTQK